MREVGRSESDAILGAMRQVALAGGHAITYADTTSVLAAARYLLRRRDLSDIGTLPAVEPPTSSRSCAASRSSRRRR